MITKFFLLIYNEFNLEFPHLIRILTDKNFVFFFFFLFRFVFVITISFNIRTYFLCRFVPICCLLFNLLLYHIFCVAQTLKLTTNYGMRHAMCVCFFFFICCYFNILFMKYLSKFVIHLSSLFVYQQLSKLQFVFLCLHVWNKRSLIYIYILSFYNKTALQVFRILFQFWQK